MSFLLIAFLAVSQAFADEQAKAKLIKDPVFLAMTKSVETKYSIRCAKLTPLVRYDLRGYTNDSYFKAQVTCLSNSKNSFNRLIINIEFLLTENEGDLHLLNQTFDFQGAGYN